MSTKNSQELANKIGNSTVIISCEGSAERAILDLILENDLSFIKLDQVLWSDYRKIDDIEDFHLNRDFGEEGFSILWICDRNIKIRNLNPLYQKSNRCLELIVTGPEIEILTIIKYKKLSDYLKRRTKNQKASDYCKRELGLKKVKDYTFVRNLFSDPKSLIQTLKEQKKYNKSRRKSAVAGSYTLLDLIK